MLWLATMRAKPFKDSINCMWHCNGCVTYLLCMLIKQHTGAGPNMHDSVLCLQATNEEPNVCRYYKCLGFSHVINFDNDNGLSQTSDEFQRIVRQKPDCWDDTSLNLFLLWRGRIILCRKGTINLTNMDNGSDSHPMKIWPLTLITWMT